MGFHFADRSSVRLLDHREEQYVCRQHNPTPVVELNRLHLAQLQRFSDIFVLLLIGVGKSCITIVEDNHFLLDVGDVSRDGLPADASKYKFKEHSSRDH